MQQPRRSFHKIGFLLIAVGLLTSRVTDADLSDQYLNPGHLLQATTLDFVNQETATNANKSLLFSVAGLIPSGFQVESLRVNNLGDQGFEYKFFVTQTGGDSELCSRLNLKILRNWQSWYDGSLLDLSLSDQLATKQAQNFVLSVSLPSEASGLANKNCSFSLTLETVDPTGKEKFSDSEVLQSQVSTGSW